MRKQNSKLSLLVSALSVLNDDTSKHWSDYPCLEWEHGDLRVYICETDQVRELIPVAYEIAVGDKPNGTTIRRWCRNIRCFRPVHMRLVWEMEPFLKAQLQELKDDPLLPWSAYPCLEWPFSRLRRPWPYGVSRKKGRTILAHRAAFEMTYGSLVDGLSVLHHCDNPPCYRPSHLFSGTALDNHNDAVVKGRKSQSAPPRRGEDNERSKLTSEQVLEIRRLKRLGHRSVDLARRFKVDKSLIYLIHSRKCWKHLID